MVAHGWIQLALLGGVVLIWIIRAERTKSSSFDSDRACVRPEAGLTHRCAVLAQDDNSLDIRSKEAAPQAPSKRKEIA